MGVLQQAGIQNPGDNEQPGPEIPQEPQGQPQPGGSSLDGDVSPEEQDAYDKVIMAAMKVLFENEETNNTIIKQLKAGAKTPAKALADVATMLIVQLDQQSGGKIPETVILPASGEILEQVSDLAVLIWIIAENLLCIVK